MIKNYIYALALSCATTVAFAQKDVAVGKLAPGASITVDGIADEVYSDPMNMSMQTITNCIVDALDCGGTTPATNCVNVAKWTAVYNDDALYIFATVTDKALTSGDIVELFFSMDNDKTSNCPANWPRAYNANTFQLELTKAAQGTVEPVSPNGMAGAVEIAKSVVTPEGYNVEVKLLFSEMDFLSGLTPVAGRKIGFDIANNDAAGAGKYQLMWNACCVNRNWTEATSFGALTLSDKILSTTNTLTSLVNKLSVYPNPAANEINVKINAKDNDNVSVSIINSLSQKVYNNNQVVTAGETLHTISTANLSNGIYTVVISKGNLKTTEMVVINK